MTAKIVYRRSWGAGAREHCAGVLAVFIALALTNSGTPAYGQQLDWQPQGMQIVDSTKAAEPGFKSTDLAAVTANANPQEYLISPDDLLEIYIVDVPELSRQYRVSPTGLVTLPLVPHALNAAGLTLDQFAELTTQELKSKGLVSNPEVTVTVKESRMHSVAITGAVKRPQIYFVLGRTTLLDVLSQAEGVTPDASSTANITRGEIARRVLAAKNQQPAPETFAVDLEKLLATGLPNLNPDIYPGDHVTIAPAGVIYVVGAVNRPGGFALTANRKELSVLQAVALAEDVKSTAVLNKAVIMRKNPARPDSREEVPVKLKDILARKEVDIPLKTDDILFIPDSAGKRALRRTAEAMIQVATGLAIRY